MKEDAPLVHEDGNLLAHWHVHRGDAEKAIAGSAYVLTEKFQTPWTEHAFLEPECAVAKPGRRGRSDHLFHGSGRVDTSMNVWRFWDFRLKK